MTKFRSLLLATVLSVSAIAPLAVCSAAQAADADTHELNRDSDNALQTLYARHPIAAEIAKHAKAILIFPNVVKAGLIFGGAYGEGELQQGSKIDGYYNTVTASWGFQAGAQSYGYVVFLMNEKALHYLHETHGWEIGVGPTVVIVDDGVAKNLSTTTLQDDAYAFIFDQQGLMAGVSLEGTKITRIHP
jgi:lipid-binding SYLF domain-containing protein